MKGKSTAGICRLDCYGFAFRVKRLFRKDRKDPHPRNGMRVFVYSVTFPITHFFYVAYGANMQTAFSFFQTLYGRNHETRKQIQSDAADEKRYNDNSYQFPHLFHLISYGIGVNNVPPGIRLGTSLPGILMPTLKSVNFLGVRAKSNSSSV